MEISNVETFVRTLKNIPEEDAVVALKQYHHKIAEQYISSTWDKCRKLINKVISNKSKRLGKYYMELDEFTGQIDMMSFLQFCALIEERIKKSYDESSDETKSVLLDIEDTIFNLLNKAIKIDRRNFQQEEDYIEHKKSL